MASSRFYIGPPQTGLQTDVKPFMISDDAYAFLQNAYVFRGRLRKRVGAKLLPNGDPADQLLSRLRIALAGGAAVGITDAGGNATGTVPGTVFKVGQLFSIGTALYTVITAGVTQPMLQTVATATATYSTTNGVYNFIGAPALTQIFFYPAEPVMGLITREIDSVNDNEVIAFDTQFAYRRSGGAWVRSTGGSDTWTATDVNFFWGTNYRGALSSDFIFFVTNNFPADGIRYFDGTTWTTLAPTVSAGVTMSTALILLPFKDRLIALNTVENGVRFPNRCRFSINGTPLTAGTSWLQTGGNAGFIEAPTRESIVSAQFLKDRLIVFFEASTWELVYISNQKIPFVWQKINTELGAESTFSEVPFDKVVLGVGNVGIHACTGASVERIDQKIPQEIFDIHNQDNGPERVYGIRDYYLETVYWSYPDQSVQNGYPNKMLVYNYANGSWAINDDSITCFGYWQAEDDITWENSPEPWELNNSRWNAGAQQALVPFVIAGNQEGWTFIFDSDLSRNSPSLQITNIDTTDNQLTIIDHNLADGDYILIENLVALDPLEELNDDIFQVVFIDNNTVQLVDGPVLTGSYLGGGTATRVSVIDIWTKDYNFFSKEGYTFAVNQVDFYVDRTESGEITVDYVPSGSNLSLIVDADGTINSPVQGLGVLETSPYALKSLEQEQDRFWHPIYCWAQGETIQLRLYLSFEQMTVPQISLSDFQLNALIITANPTEELGG